MTTTPRESDTKRHPVTYGDALPLAIAIIGGRRADKATKTLKRESKLREYLKAAGSFRTRLRRICDQMDSFAAVETDVDINDARYALLLRATCDAAASLAPDDQQAPEKNFEFLRSVRAYRLAKLTVASTPNIVPAMNGKKVVRAAINASALKIVETMHAADDIPDVFAVSELLLEVLGGKLPLPRSVALRYIDSCITSLATETERVRYERNAKKLRKGPGAIDVEGIVHQTLASLLRSYLTAEDKSQRTLISHAVTRFAYLEDETLASICLSTCLDLINAHAARVMVDHVAVGMQNERIGFIFHIAELLLRRNATSIKAVSAISAAEASVASSVAKRCMAPLALRIRRLSAMVRLRSELASNR